MLDSIAVSLLQRLIAALKSEGETIAEKHKDVIEEAEFYLTNKNTLLPMSKAEYFHSGLSLFD